MSYGWMAGKTLMRSEGLGLCSARNKGAPEVEIHESSRLGPAMYPQTNYYLQFVLNRVQSRAF